MRNTHCAYEINFLEYKQFASKFKTHGCGTESKICYTITY